MRSGLLAKKIGMTRIYNENGVQIPVTVLKVDENAVLAKKTISSDGYNAVKLACTPAKAKNISSPMRGVFAKAKIEPRMHVAEFRVSPDHLIEVGEALNAGHFTKGQLVDVRSVSIGKGFAGAMKRHNFGGLRASHGVSVSHRSHGSTGGRQDPGKVFKGKKMAGHMGNRYVTIQNLLVVLSDSDKGLIYINGSVPGAKGSMVTLRDAVKVNKPISSDLSSSPQGGNS